MNVTPITGTGKLYWSFGVHTIGTNKPSPNITPRALYYSAPSLLSDITLFRKLKRFVGVWQCQGVVDWYYDAQESSFSRWDNMAILSRCSLNEMMVPYLMTTYRSVTMLNFLLVSMVRWKNPHPALGFTGKWRHKPLPHFLVSVISIPYASEETQTLGSFILCFATFPCLITMVIPQLWFTMRTTKTFRH